MSDGSRTLPWLVVAMRALSDAKKGTTGHLREDIEAAEQEVETAMRRIENMASCAPDAHVLLTHYNPAGTQPATYLQCNKCGYVRTTVDGERHG